MKNVSMIIMVFVCLLIIAFAKMPPPVFSEQETFIPKVTEKYQPPERKLPEKFNNKWYRVRPRTEKGIYPNVPEDWEPMENPRYEVAENRPLKGLRICVDAGHGGQLWGPTHGYTGGTRGRNTGFLEDEANLRVAFFLWDLLTQAGAEVTMTRKGPDRMSEACFAPLRSKEWQLNRHKELYSRVQIADEAGCDYFITIHHNAGAPTNYLSCYYFDTSQWDDEYNESAPYVKRYSDEELNRERYQMTIEIQNAMSRTLDLRVINPAMEWSRMYYGYGVPSHNITVLRESKIVGVLVEVSFMTDPEEDVRLNDPARAKQAAKGVYEGILGHFRYRPIKRWSERPLAKPQPD